MKSILLLSVMIFVPETIWGQAASAQAASPVPASLVQTASRRVDLTYTEGRLTIRAHGEPLVDILREACSQIGAELDLQAMPSNPVTGTFGPKIPKEVFKALLNDVDVNYVVVPTETDPNAVAKVAILAVSGGGAARPLQAAAEPAAEARENAPAATPYAADPSFRSANTQLKELVEAAKAEVVKNGGHLAIETGDDGDGNPATVDAALMIQQVENMLKMAEEAAAKAAQNPQGDSAVAPNPAPGRPSGRRH